jgi:hypothetical protein
MREVEESEAPKGQRKTICYDPKEHPVEDATDGSRKHKNAL